MRPFFRAQIQTHEAQQEQIQETKTHPALHFSTSSQPHTTHQHTMKKLTESASTSAPYQIIMTSRQSEIAAEAYAASVLARSGYDVSVQYGARQPHYDLIGEKNGRILLISVKGNQDGGWPLAISHKNKDTDYHQSIDKWLACQRKDIVFILVQFLGVSLTGAPRVYVARPKEIAAYMKSQCNGRGHATLWEDHRRDYPRSQYFHKIPDEWTYSQDRIDTI